MVRLAALKLIRERRAFTQQQLADKAGVSRVTIVRLEAGKDGPFPTTVRKLADALGIDPEDLMEPVRSADREVVPTPHLAVINETDVNRLLREHPDLATVVKQAVDQLESVIPDASLTLRLVTDPDYGSSEQLFLGVSTELPDDEALAALSRFDEEWWVRHIRRTGGLLCIDLSDG